MLIIKNSAGANTLCVFKLNSVKWLRRRARLEKQEMYKKLGWRTLG